VVRICIQEFSPFEGEIDSKTIARLNKIFCKCFVRAGRFVQSHRDEIAAVAAALYVRKRLTADEVKALCRGDRRTPIDQRSPD
jgi:hypothetical protein